MPLINNWKDIADTLKNLVTSCALLAGGIWSYRLFVRQRLGLPRLKATITPYAVRIEQGWILNVQVQVENIGSVVASIKRAELRMRQVVPLPNLVASKITEGFDPVVAGEAEVGWPMLAGREWSWEAACEVEPGETDALIADFFVPADVEVVQFYFFAANERKRRRNLGWPVTMIHELQRKEQITMAEQKGTQFRSGQQQPQQKQQPQQRPQQQVQPQQQQTQVSKKK